MCWVFLIIRSDLAMHVTKAEILDINRINSL